jgi:hypothetical protein
VSGEGAQAHAQFRCDVATITRVKNGTIITLVLADVNVKVGGRGNEVDVVLDRRGDGVRSASNVRGGTRAMFVDFKSGAD